MKHLPLFFCLASLLACKKDKSPYVLSWEYCRDNVKFTCVEPKGAFFFSGKIDHNPFCFSDGVDEYIIYNGVRSEYVTSAQNPTLPPGATPIAYSYTFGFLPPIMDNLNGLVREFSPWASLITPATMDSTLGSEKNLIEKFIHEGDLTLRDKFIDKFSGFEFDLIWACAELPGYDYYHQNQPNIIPIVSFTLTNTIGDQTNSKLSVSEFKKTVTPDNIIYEITFHIECNLYYQDASNNRTVLYGRLSDGILKTKVVTGI